MLCGRKKLRTYIFTCCSEMSKAVFDQFKVQDSERWLKVQKLYLWTSTVIFKPQGALAMSGVLLRVVHTRNMLAPSIKLHVHQPVMQPCFSNEWINYFLDVNGCLGP